MSLESDLVRSASAISDAVGDILFENRIHKLSSHGWVGPDDVDPEEVGHAMWQLDDPADAAIMREWNETEPLILPEWKILCSVAGADFEGLMNGARLSIGYALFQINRLGESLDDEDSLGAMHSRAATMALGAASERIREYFVAGIFRMSPKAYINQDENRAARRRRAMYITPFADAESLVVDIISLGACIDQLQTMAEKIKQYRDSRNALVHRVATELGRMRQRVIDNASRGEARIAEWQNLTEADFAHIASQSKLQQRARIEEALVVPMDWYRLLIDFAERVFYAENRFRSAKI